MRERDSGRALKRAIARRKLEDPTWEAKERVRRRLAVVNLLAEDNPRGGLAESLREELKAQLREESGPGWSVAKPGDAVEVLSGDLEGMHFVVHDVYPDGPVPDDPPSSGWGWLLAILAGLAAWGALIVLLMCVWAAVKHG